MGGMVKDSIKEVIFIGMPGPTHHYGGLSGDNVAATTSRGDISRPRQAAHQVLELIGLLKRLGQTVALLPPQLRPHLPLLREHFSGDDDAVIRQAAKELPELLEKSSSSSAMWTANAATVTPALDAADVKLHLTPANLHTHVHRRIEAEATHRTLAAIFKGVPAAMVHSPLPAPEGLADEGAANHMCLAPHPTNMGLHVFIYGEAGRQSLAASQAIRLQHQIADAQALFVRQSPDVIHQGVFHNDVIAVNHAQLLLAHEEAYAPEDFGRIAQAYHVMNGKDPLLLLVKSAELSVKEAVDTYLFNSQIITLPKGGMAIIAPQETRVLHNGKAAALLERIREAGDNPIEEVHYIDLRQSMKNGGGPACLRLRVPMAEAQLAAMRQSVHVLADDALLAAFEKNIERFYPEELSPQDLGNPELYHQCKALLEALGKEMRLPLL